ncbi:MAG: hypothetical protein RLZZ312_1866, partial [Bacteroidota bacterium]
MEALLENIKIKANEKIFVKD